MKKRVKRIAAGLLCALLVFWGVPFRAAPSAGAFVIAVPVPDDDWGAAAWGTTMAGAGVGYDDGTLGGSWDYHDFDDWRDNDDWMSDPHLQGLATEERWRRIYAEAKRQWIALPDEVKAGYTLEQQDGRYYFRATEEACRKLLELSMAPDGWADYVNSTRLPDDVTTRLPNGRYLYPESTAEDVRAFLGLDVLKFSGFSGNVRNLRVVNVIPYSSIPIVPDSVTSGLEVYNHSLRFNFNGYKWSVNRWLEVTGEHWMRNSCFYNYPKYDKFVNWAFYVKDTGTYFYLVTFEDAWGRDLIGEVVYDATGYRVNVDGWGLYSDPDSKKYGDAGDAQDVFKPTYEDLKINGQDVFNFGVGGAWEALRNGQDVQDGTIVLHPAGDVADGKVTAGGIADSWSQTQQDVITGDKTDVGEGEGEGEGEKPVDPPATNLPNGMPNIPLPEILFKEKFPFCIPWDLYNAFAGLAVPAVPLKVTIPFLHVDRFNWHYDITLDFAEFEKLAQITRWGFSLTFLIGLILITRKMIGA